MAAPTLVVPSFTNGYLPEPTDQCVAFARNERQYKINQYCQYVPAPTPLGVFAQLGRDEFVANRGGSVAPSGVAGGAGSTQKAWQPGDDVPDGEDSQIPFLFQEFRCEYRFQAWRLPYQEIDLTKAFNIKLAYMQAAMTKMLTDRTNRAVGQLVNPSNWGTHTAAANALNGGAGPVRFGSDDPSSPQYLAFLKCLQAASRQIHLDTNGVVDQSMLQVVFGPDMAIGLSESAELVNYCRETPQAIQLTKDGFDPQWERWGIPSSYRGFKLVVEDCPIVTANVNTTNWGAGGGYPNQPAQAAEGARSYIWPANVIVMMARVGGLDGEFGSRNYSTFQIFHYGPLAQVRAFDEPRHMRVLGDVNECIDLIIAANMSGYCITNAY